MDIKVGQRQSNYTADYIAALNNYARNIRLNILKMLNQAGSGHTAGSLGLVEIMTALYFAKLRFNQYNPIDDGRDLLVLSNGHVCPVLYATLAEAGLIERAELMTLRRFGSRLQGHPERSALPWLETTSGPLGEGLSQATGMAYALKYLTVPNDRLVYCIIGDGETNEGNIYEATLTAGKYRLNNLICIMDYNDIQLSGTTTEIMPLGQIADNWAGMGWNILDLADGNDMVSVLRILDQAIELSSDLVSPKPTLILAHTTPGKGVSFMENDYRWHGKAPTDEQLTRAIAELIGDKNE